VSTVTPLETGNRKAPPPLVLRLVRGAHRGAERACRDRDVFVIGSAEDCDLVLPGDKGVAAHHCMVRVMGGCLYVRSLDALIKINGNEVTPGEPVLVQAFQRVELGHAAFAMGPSWSPHWGAFDSANDDIVETKLASEYTETMPDTAAQPLQSAAAVAAAPARKLPVWLLPVVLSASAALAALMFAWWPGASTGPLKPQQRLEQVKSMIAAADYHEVKAELLAGKITLSGVARTGESVRALAEKLAKKNIAVSMRVLSGEQVADQVRELLKVSGVGARSEYIGERTVQMTGHFGDGKALALAVGQAAMQDILPGLKVRAVNQDTPASLPAPEPPKFLGAMTGIKSICNATDCFLQVGANGSTYYIGSELPGGGKLIDVKEAFAVIDFEQNRYKVRLKDLYAERISAIPAGSSAEGLAPETENLPPSGERHGEI
jgi:hypothetical protein